LGNDTKFKKAEFIPPAILGKLKIAISLMLFEAKCLLIGLLQEIHPGCSRHLLKFPYSPFSQSELSESHIIPILSIDQIPVQRGDNLTQLKSVK